MQLPVVDNDPLNLTAIANSVETSTNENEVVSDCDEVIYDGYN
jgi:hypothetical protein